MENPQRLIVFISREVGTDSTFRQQLEALGWEVRGQSLLTLCAVDFRPPPPTDWLFFYSGNGVRFFLAKTPAMRHYKRLAVIGPSTAKVLEDAGHTPDFVGTGDPVTTATAFLPLATGQTVVFVGAAQSRQSVQTLLGDAVHSQHWTVYDNQPLEEFPAQDAAHTLVFTSPLSASSYLSRYAIGPEQNVVAIGESTASALRKAGVSRVKVSDVPTEEGLARAVLASG